MNIINKALLHLILMPAGLYRKLGIDLPQLRSIVNTKLLMDDRRPNTFQQTSRRKKGKEVSLATVGTMLLSLLLGLIYLYAFMVGKNMITHLTIYFSMFFFMLSATLITDFTSVLIDVRDTFIILPKPVNDRTLITARLLHIFIHLCKIVLPMSIPGVIMAAYDNGPAGAALLFLIALLVTLFVLFFINALYILILRFTKPQKFQSIISYIQIVFAIVIYASYQLIPRMADILHMNELDLSGKPFIIFYPIYWFACLWQALMTFNVCQSIWIAAILGFILPFVSIWIVVKFLAPSFNNKLAMISSTVDTGQPAKPVSVHRKINYAEWLSRIFTKGFIERMGFQFTWKMTSRSRDFKMRVYPTIGYLVVYLVIVFWNGRHINFEKIRDQGAGSKVLIISALYFSSFLLTMALNQMIYSEKYKAAWIFYVSPLQNPGEVILGAAKAAILKFYIPLVILITGTGIFLIGPSVIPNLVLGLFNQLLIAFILVFGGNIVFPFSLHQNTNVKAGSFIRSMSILFVSGLIAFGHYLIYDFLPAVLLCSLISLLALWYITGSIKNTTWKAIKTAYEE